MREQLIQYVELLFAGARDSDDIKQEILQNTLDRYDDLIDQGKVPEAAYRLAIAGIGDINEILGTSLSHTAVTQKNPEPDDGDSPKKKLMRAIAVGLYILCPLPLIVLGDIGMDILGLCGTLSIVAAATILIMLGAKKDSREQEINNAATPQSELSKSISGVIWAVGLGVYCILSFSTRAWHMTWTIFPVLAALDALAAAMIRNQETQHSDIMHPDKKRIRKRIGQLIWAAGIAVYFIFSFATAAWYISWLLFPITGAVQGLAYAIMDLKEAKEYET